MNSEVSHDATNLHPQNGVICRGHQNGGVYHTTLLYVVQKLTNVGGNDS